MALNFVKVKLCQGCELHKHRRNQVIGQGLIPAKVLFIGESPNKTEDLFGQLFIGPNVNLFNRMLEGAAELANVKTPSCYFTNTVLCRPWIWDPNDKDYCRQREPSKQEILSCMTNVMHIYRIIKPQSVVFVGRIAETYYKKEFPSARRITPVEVHLTYGGKVSPTYLQDVRTLTEVFQGLK